MKYDKCCKAYEIPSVLRVTVFDFSGPGKHRWMDLAVAAVPVVTAVGSGGGATGELWHFS